jgi:hypothetical protein
MSSRLELNNKKFASREEIRMWKTGSSRFFRAKRPFPLSVSLTSARLGKMDADKGKRSLRAKKFASACGKMSVS